MDTSIFIFILSYLIIGSDAVLTCPKTDGGGGQSWDEIVVSKIFDFGEPEMFVTSYSQYFDPYSLIDMRRRTAILNEYLMLGYRKLDHKPDVVEEMVQLVLYNGVSSYITDPGLVPDVVHQNLENELYFRFFNSTGVYPWMTILNATTEKRVQFHAKPYNEKTTHGISYGAALAERSYFYEPQVPFDAIFEIPGNSRVLRSDKTLIQYQSFSLWRWRLSNKTADWSEVSAVEVDESSNKGIGIQGEFKRIENPCTKDMFLLYSERGSGSNKKLYLASPLIQSHLKEDWFYDMATDDHPWASDTPTAIVLTNDHFIVMTGSSLWVSESLNDTNNEDDLSMTTNYTDRPSLKYVESNPCSGFKGTFLCFDEVNSEQKLFYNPVCYLYQMPHYEDYVIFVLKNMEEEQHSFTILYASRPYNEWRILFSSAYYYRRYTNDKGKQMQTQYNMSDIVGVFFNHHSKQFDLTIKVEETISGGKQEDGDDDSGKTRNLFIRFSLSETSSKAFTYGRVVEQEGDLSRKELDGLMGEGITEFLFPDNFEVESVVVNGDTQDVFFLGNQLWIAEAGSIFVYPALTGLAPGNSVCSNFDKETEDVNENTGIIRECSFNHPDRTYVCTNEHRNLIFAGRIGSTYSPIVTQISQIVELQNAQVANVWSSAYLCEIVQKRAVFVAGYSGRILMWYLNDPQKAEQGSILSSPDGDPVCQPKTRNEALCTRFKELQERRCTAEPLGEPGFRMLTIDPTKLESNKVSSDGPLVPFLIDSNAAVLFEGIVPDEDGNQTGFQSPSYYTYFSDVNVGQKIYCNNYELLKADANNQALIHTCELFLQHIKSVENFLVGFRRSLYVLILQSIPMLPVPADIIVLVASNSNKALIKIDDHINTPEWTFEEKHIGQTLYLPGEFSILLSGFSKAGSKTIMEGYTTLYVHHEYRVVFNAFFSFLMDMSTQTYRLVQKKRQGIIQKKNLDRLAKIDKQFEEEREAEVKTRKTIREEWSKSLGADVMKGGIAPDELYAGEIPPYVKREEVEDKLLTVKDDEISEIFPKGSAKGPVIEVTEPPEEDLVYGKVEYDKRIIWYPEESECDYVITLAKNPVLKSHGGRISLDLHDRISFEVQLRAFTRIGKLMMYRPLLVLTNSNPSVLKVEMREKLIGDPQVMQIKIGPTGFQKGISVLTVRSVVSSMRCQHTTSVTFIVLVHRDVGRRLHIHYPIPTCKPTGHHGMYPRLWYEDQPGCITREELLSKDKDMEEIIRYRGNRRHVTYITLPPNYRPPSFDGSDIPTSKNIYNGDPSKPKYNTWYKISQESFEFDLCKDKKHKSECICNANDRLMDDEVFTECKEKVFYTQRTGGERPLLMSATYDRLMRDEDQDQELFGKKLNWSVTIEEVNGRSEWFVDSPPSSYLKMINTRNDLSEGMRHYDMKSFSVGLLGTGLFHFKVTLGRFESFDETTGYFMIYVANDEFNHLHLFMILLGTIIFCMTMVFLGFIAARKRLSSMLPIQPMSHRRKLKLL